MFTSRTTTMNYYAPARFAFLFLHSLHICGLAPIVPDSARVLCPSPHALRASPVVLALFDHPFYPHLPVDIRHNSWPHACPLLPPDWHASVAASDCVVGGLFENNHPPKVS